MVGKLADSNRLDGGVLSMLDSSLSVPGDLAAASGHQG